MRSINIKYSMWNYLMIFLLLICFSSCKLDDSIYIDPIEIGTDENTYIIPPEEGELEFDVFANKKIKLDYIDPLDWGALSHSEVSKDTKVKFAYTENLGFPRMARVLLSSLNTDKRDTVYIKQEGVLSYLLNFKKLSETCAGAGGTIALGLETNLALEDLNVTIKDIQGDDVEWINSSLQITDGHLVFVVQANPHQTELRRAIITLSTIDGWGQLLTTSVLLTQANAQEKFGEKLTFDQARTYFNTDTVRDDVYIEGIVISNKESRNVGDAPQLTTTSWDRTVTNKTAYIQTLDGSRGFMVLFNQESDNILAFGSKVELLLTGTQVLKSFDDGPERYTISNVSLTNLLNITVGDQSNIQLKEKFIGELVPNDMYTYVTLKDCEFPIRKGSLSMIDEGYSGVLSAESFRIGKSVRLVRDIEGGSLYLFTNTSCPYRRAGAGAFSEPTAIPFGSGSLSGVVVHERHSRYEWDDTDNDETYGRIGDYQIRHQKRDDINFKQKFEDGFSDFVAEWQYYHLEGGVFKATKGNGVLSHTSSKSNAVIKTTRDYSALAMGTRETLTGGNGCFLPNGTTLLPVNEDQGNNKGKGWFVGKDGYSSAWLHNFWWDTTKDMGESWLIEFSTEGITTNKLSLQVSVLNSAKKSPRDFAVEWSTQDATGKSTENWTHIADYTVPDYPEWASIQNHQSNAFKEINIPLPLGMLGKSKVYIRLRAKSPYGSSGTAYRDFDIRGEANNTTPGAASSMNYFAIRYNK